MKIYTQWYPLLRPGIRLGPGRRHPRPEGPFHPFPQTFASSDHWEEVMTPRSPVPSTRIVLTCRSSRVSRSPPPPPGSVSGLDVPRTLPCVDYSGVPTPMGLHPLTGSTTGVGIFSVFLRTYRGATTYGGGGSDDGTETGGEDRWREDWCPGEVWTHVHPRPGRSRTQVYRTPCSLPYGPTHFDSEDSCRWRGGEPTRPTAHHP